MKTTGQSGSSSEYTIFDENSFVHQGIFYRRDWLNGRHYRFDTPRGLNSRLNRKGLMAQIRISAAVFTRLYHECAEMISESEKRSAA